jgi:hypothetical protein
MAYAPIRIKLRKPGMIEGVWGSSPSYRPAAMTGLIISAANSVGAPNATLTSSINLMHQLGADPQPPELYPYH